MGTLCFWDRPQKYKNISDNYEAPHGPPREAATPSTFRCSGRLCNTAGFLTNVSAAVEVGSEQPLGGSSDVAAVQVLLGEVIQVEPNS